MSVVARVYAKTGFNLLRQNYHEDLHGTTNLKCALLLDTYLQAGTFLDRVKEDDNWDDVNDYEAECTVTSPVYVAGGKEITSVEVEHVLNGTETLVVKLDGSDVEWADSRIIARFAVVYDDGPSGDANKKLLCVADFGESRESYDGLFAIRFHDDGILTTSPEDIT